MNILTAYTLKYLRLNKKRTAVTILGVILSSALTCGVFLLGVSFQQVMIDHEIYMAGNWHAEFHGVPTATAKYITGNSAVQAAMFSASLGNAVYGSHNIVRPYLAITAYDALSFQNRNVRLLAGRLPQNEDELLISPVMAGDSGLGLKPGSTVDVTFGRRNIPNHDEMVKAWGGEEYVALADGETFIPAAGPDATKTYTVVGLMAPLADETAMPAAFRALTYLDPAQPAPGDKVDIAILTRDPRTIYTSAPAMAQSAGLQDITGPDGRPTESSDAGSADAITYNEDLLTWMGLSGRTGYVRFFLLILATLIALIVGGSALVIYNAFAISIGERKKQFGMFAGVGATPAQIRRIVLTEAGVIAAIGIPLGILGAVLGVALLLRLTEGIVAELIVDAEEGMPLIVAPGVVGLTVLFAAATTLVSAWIPAGRAARVSPMTAIRQSGEFQAGSQGDKPLNLRTNPLVRRLFGFEGELALKSLKRDRKRYRTTVFSLMISIILFVAFNALMLYTDKTQQMAVKAMNFDLMIDLDYRQSHANQFADEVGKLPQVQRVAYDRCAHMQYAPAAAEISSGARAALRELTNLEFESLPSVVHGGTYQFVLKVCAVGPAEFARYAAQLGLDVAQYSDAAAPRGILINHTNLRQGGKLYDFDLFNLRAGDTLTATQMTGYTAPQVADSAPVALAASSPANPAANPVVSSPANPVVSSPANPAAGIVWTVGAVTEETPLGMMGLTLVPEMIVSDVLFDALTARMQQLGPVNPGHMTVQSDDPDAALAAIERLYKGTVGGNFSYQSMKEFNRSNSLRTLLTNLFFYGFLALITLIGVTNIVNTLDTNIKLRRREIAMLKSVGLTPGGFQRMLRYESLFYGLTALGYGLPLGILVSVFIYYQFDGVSTFAFTLPWGAILGCVAGILAIVFATMMVSGAMIRNDNIVDTLKEENL